MQQTRFQQLCTQLFTGLILAILVDSMWIGLVAKNLYVNHFASSVLSVPDRMLPYQWLAAILAWFLLVVGIVIFVLPKTVKKKLWYATRQGALFGLVVYGCYDFTNYAILQYWPMQVVIIDVIWGCILCSFLTTALSWMQLKK